MSTTGTARPWAPQLAGLPAARAQADQAVSDTRPVLLHQGFMIETGHVWRRFADALRVANRPVITLEEHYLRTIDSAHALGHDPDLALAQSLAGALDEFGVESVDVVGEGTGAAAALLLAMNDSRVRRLVLWRPAGLNLDEKGALLPTADSPLQMTYAEASIGVVCAHAAIETITPSPWVRCALSDIDIPVLVIDTPDSEAVHALDGYIPNGMFAPSADHQLMLDNDLLITRARDFLSAPVEVPRHQPAQRPPIPRS
jgi:pimeloyl-ACP methyl ester carboxylesterase